MNQTKKAMAESLKRLLLKKPLSKITINDIAEDCGMSRMTFYYHFQDIYALVEWICEEDARAILNRHRPYGDWEQAFLSILETVRDNQHFIINVFRSVDRPQIEHYLRRITEKLLIDIIDSEAARLNISEENKSMVTAFYKYALVGVTLEWIDHGAQKPPEEIVATTAMIVRGDLLRALEDLSEGEV